MLGTKQQKKVNELGELPALDWKRTIDNLALFFGICGVLLITTIIWEKKCIKLGYFCLREWCYTLCTAIGAYFSIELFAKVRGDGSLLPLIWNVQRVSVGP